MKTSDAERTTEDSSVTHGSSTGGLALNHIVIKQVSARTAATTSPQKSIAVITRSDWPLPAPLPHATSVQPRQAKLRREPQEDTIQLSRGELETLTALQARCKQAGVKLKKNDLLAIGLQLLADAPTGKLLAILGPYDSKDFSLKRRKKKAPPHA